MIDDPRVGSESRSSGGWSSTTNTANIVEEIIGGPLLHPLPTAQIWYVFQTMIDGYSLFSTLASRYQSANQNNVDVTCDECVDDSIRQSVLCTIRLTGHESTGLFSRLSVVGCRLAAILYISMFFTSTLTFQVIISLLKPQEGSYPLYGTNRTLWFNIFSTQFHKLNLISTIT